MKRIKYNIPTTKNNNHKVIMRSIENAKNNNRVAIQSLRNFFTATHRKIIICLDCSEVSITLTTKICVETMSVVI